MLLAYARASTTHQDVERQITALLDAGIDRDKIWVDTKTGAHTHRPGLAAVVHYARKGDVIVVVTLDRLARNLRDTLNLIHQLSERGIGIRSLHDPIPVDTLSPDLLARMSVMMLALFAEMERVWNRERVAHARTKAGRSPGRKKALTTAQVNLAVQIRAAGATIPMICKALGGVGRSTVYRAFAEHHRRGQTTSDISADDVGH
jgi:DNA invertase Pin-like site-specific DNA recombinase